jgi:hypothetical protein
MQDVDDVSFERVAHLDGYPPRDRAHQADQPAGAVHTHDQLRLLGDSDSWAIRCPPRVVMWRGECPMDAIVKSRRSEFLQPSHLVPESRQTVGRQQPGERHVAVGREAGAPITGEVR